MLITKPGVRGIKIPVDSKKVQKQPGIILGDYILKKVNKNKIFNNCNVLREMKNTKAKTDTT